MIREQIKEIQQELCLGEGLDGLVEILNTVLYEYMSEEEAISFIIDSLMITDKEFNELYIDATNEEK
jgi:hypothetical protein